MRAWTDELLKRFPQMGQIEHRPWWSDYPYTRKDGVHIYARNHPGVFITPGWWVAVGGVGLDLIQQPQTRSSTGSTEPPLDLLAEVDRLYPLPHPGYRIGQVWALPNGCAFTVAEVDSHGVAFVLLRSWGQGEPVDTADPSAGKSYPARLFPLPRKATFLITDPCCPDRAPWSECVT